MVALPDEPVPGLAAHMIMFHTRSPTAPATSRKLYGVSYARELFDAAGPFRADLRTGEDTELHGRLDIEIEWAPEVRNSHRGPATVRALLADRFVRGRRTAEVAHLHPGSPTPRRVAVSALRNIGLCAYWSWHGASREERLRQVRAWPLLPAATASFFAGVLTA